MRNKQYIIIYLKGIKSISFSDKTVPSSVLLKYLFLNISSIKSLFYY